MPENDHEIGTFDNDQEISGTFENDQETGALENDQQTGKFTTYDEEPGNESNNALGGRNKKAFGEQTQNALKSAKQTENASANS